MLLHRLREALWKEGGGNVLLGILYVDVTLTHTTYLNTTADQVHPFMTGVFPDRGDQQDNGSMHRAKTQDQQWFEGHDDSPRHCLQPD